MSKFVCVLVDVENGENAKVTNSPVDGSAVRIFPPKGMRAGEPIDLWIDQLRLALDELEEHQTE